MLRFPHRKVWSAPSLAPVFSLPRTHILPILFGTLTSLSSPIGDTHEANMAGNTHRTWAIARPTAMDSRVRRVSAVSATPSQLAPLSALAGLPLKALFASISLYWPDSGSDMYVTLMPHAISLLHVPSWKPARMLSTQALPPISSPTSLCYPLAH